MRNYLLKICYLFVWIVIYCSNAYPEGNKKESNSKLNKPNAQKNFSSLNINNISSYFYNNGISDVSLLGIAGFVYPKRTGKTAVFTSGLLWGAKVAGFVDPRVGGTAYRTGLVPGKVLPDGTADDPTLDKYRIYRVRRDIYPGGPPKDLLIEAVSEGTDAASLRAAYETDWTQWPAETGAPFEDKDSNGIYNPDKDIPGFPGADQTLWYVTNDLTPGQITYLYGSDPLGIECQVTIWAYNRSGGLGNMYFRKYKLINITDRTTTPVTFNDMYLSMWSDVDLGDGGDDFVGVDTVLSLQYSYNAKANDNIYNPLPPPAVGFDFFQGPLINGIAGQDKNINGVDDASDYGIFNNKKVGPGKINLPMTAAYYFANGDPNLGDPPQGNSDGSRQFYNFFQGKYGISGTPFINLATGAQTSFALSGDPVKGSGWIDGVQLPPGDRRQGSASGPFNMAPGDTQEVVVAEIVAGAVPGIDRLSAITLLKVYDQQAQKAYDAFFDIPQAPPAPVVKTTQLDKEIVLNWATDEANYLATENSNSKGYKFQGYNVYQLPAYFSTITEGRRIATFDIVDNIRTIFDLVLDPISGSVVRLPVQFGTDNGIRRIVSIKNDDIKGGSPLQNGVKYYFAVTAYNYNPDPMAMPNNLENPISIITVTPQTPDTGNGSGGTTGQILQMTHIGAAAGNPSATIVDPGAILGHDYELYFSTRQEIRDQNGDWIAGSKVSRKFNVNHPDTLTGSTLDAAAVYGHTTGGIEVDLKLNLISSDFDFADGITITFPEGTVILQAPKFNSGNGTISPIINGTTVVFGDVSQSHTGNGPFAGGEEWIVQIGSLSLPFVINWTLFDDGYGGGPINVSGTSTITSIGTKKRTAKYWNVKDATTNFIKLENQGTFVDKTDPTGFATINYFPKRDDIPVKSTTSADPVVDGFQIGVDGTFDAPLNFNKDKLALTRGPGSTSNLIQSTSASATAISIVNYSIFGFPSSQAKDCFGFGTTELSQLQQDYELRFTGVWDTVVVGSQTIIKVKDGTGSFATIFSGLNTNSIKNHPLNPNPGSIDPFLIRIPFEVWNKETKKQVNLIFRDRIQEATVSPFYAWNPKNRMYGIVINSDYNGTTPITGALRDSATWVLVFYGTNYHVGDVVSVYYDNPFVIGIDKYMFSTDNLVGIAEGNNLSPNEYFLYQNFPNPFNPTTTIKYDIPKEGLVTIKIFDILGREVETLVNEEKPAGKYQITFNAKKLSSGIYFYSIKTGDYIKTLKSILLK